jgi:DNA polymerase elongation subunit (family B)
VRRYCLQDAQEVDRLSSILMAPSFALASMVPKPYERIATSGTGQGFIEPLMVRAYLSQAQSLPVGHESGAFPGGWTGVFTTGVVHTVVKADVASLYPSVMLTDRIAPASDRLDVFLDLLAELTQLRLYHKSEARAASLRSGRSGTLAASGPSSGAPGFHESMQLAMKVLINSFYGTLGASSALFCDPTAAERVTERGRTVLMQLLDELRRRGATLLEADTDGVLFSPPPREDGLAWSHEDELALIEDVARSMPPGIHLEHDGRYRAMYSYLEKNYALLHYDADRAEGYQQRDALRLVGVAFRSTRSEPYVEIFVREALRLMLFGQGGEIRELYRATCRRLRARDLPAADLCVSVPLTKTPQSYARSGRKEEPYEVYLAAGRSGWNPGTRIRYYQSKSSKQLLRQGAADYDVDYYVSRLAAAAKQRLSKGFVPSELDVLLSETPGLFDPPIDSIRTTCTTYAEPIVFASEGGTQSDQREGGPNTP